MSRSKFFKILIATLSLCLILGAAIGTVAFAGEDKGDEQKGIVVDFESDYSSYLTHAVNSNFAAGNTFELYKDDSGDTSLHLNKTLVDNESGRYLSGMNVKPQVTYREDYGNIAILEFDVRYENGAAKDNQITANHTYGTGNANTPFLLSLPKIIGREFHVTLTYKVTEYDASGNPVNTLTTLQIDDEEPTVVEGVYGANLKSGKTRIPTPMDITLFSVDINNSFLGDAYYDNFCAKVVHEHELAGGACACGYEDPDYDGLKILSKNVEYGSKTYLYYAVPVRLVKADDRAAGNLWLNVCDEDGTLAFKQYPEEEQKMVWGELCYIFKTRGVPAKELNTVERVQVETASGDMSSVESYSVQEYLYDKLYEEGYAAKTESDVGADGKDYIRRNLYYGLLKYGVLAQQLLAPDAKNKIGGVYYVNAPAATATLGRFEQPTTVAINYDDSKTPEGKIFVGWEYALYNDVGDLIDAGYAQDGASFVTNGYASFKPAFNTVNHKYDTFDDGSFGNVSYSFGGSNSNVSFGNVSISDGKFVAQKTMTYNEYKNAIKTWNAANPDNTISDPGSISLVPSVGVGTRVSGANVVEFVTDFSYKGSGSLEYIEIYTGTNANSPGSKIWGIYVPIENGHLKFNGEYISGSNRNNNVVLSPIKADGTVYRLTIRYILENGEGRLEFYCDGQLFYVGRQFTISSTPTIDQIGMVRFRMSNSPKGTITLDNTAMTQAKSEYTQTFDELVADENMIDFNSDYTDNLVITTNANFASLNKWEVLNDPVTGDGYLFVDKQGVDSTSALLGGVSFKVTPTEIQENANIAVFEFDIQFKKASGLNANQFTLQHQGQTGNSYSPFIPSFSKQFQTDDGIYHHVCLTYQVLSVDADGVPIDYYYELSLDGVVAARGELPKYNASGFKVNGGKYDFPKISQIDSITFSLNNAFSGEAYIDNVSLALANREGCAPVVAERLTNIPTTSEQPDITFDEMPEETVFRIMSFDGYSTFEVVDNYTDSANVTKENVLHMNKLSGKNAGFTVVTPTVVDGDGDALVLTFDMLTTNGTGGVEFYSCGSGCLFEASSFLTANKWSKVTIIVQQGKSGIKASLYVDGVIKKAGFAEKKISDSSPIELRWWGSAVTDCYFANVSWERVNYSELFK